MFILRDLLSSLQQDFSTSKLGIKRSIWFAYTLVAIIVPFTSSITSNLLRSLNTLFGFSIRQQRFYDFMGSSTLPWKRLWRRLWGMIPAPATDGRLLVALDDMINTKSGEKIFGCGFFHDHASKKNQSSYPWSQCIVSVGLLKVVKGRWACLPLAFRFYLMEKDIAAAQKDPENSNARFRGKLMMFESKFEQAAQMLQELYQWYRTPVLVVADSWFGNNGLWSRLNGAGEQFHLLSRLRTNNVLYERVSHQQGKRKRGRPRKYGAALGSVDDCALLFRECASHYTIPLYGKRRTVEAYSQVVMLKTLKAPVRVVWVFRRTRYVALYTTDLKLSVEQIIEYYGARWKIESGFKEIKQEIGSARSQTRDAQAVTNHLAFCMMATSLVWIYADRLQSTPSRRHQVLGRTSFAFSDVRRLIAEDALDPDFQRVCPTPQQSPQKTFVSELLRMVA